MTPILHAERARRPSAARMLLAIATIGMLGMCAELARPHRCSEACFGGNDKVGFAEYTVRSYAVDALPAWQQRHPLAWCPADLSELDEWMTNEDVDDPWGHAYRGSCWYEHGAWTMIATSAGPDGHFGTSDDIRSDR